MAGFSKDLKIRNRYSLETIIEDLRVRNSSEETWEKAKKLLTRVNWMKVARRMGGLAFNVATGSTES